LTLPLRINAGGPAYTDSSGNLWQADEFYTGGTAGSTATTITGTTDQPVYQTERWGNSNYDIPLPDGIYTVKLDLDEINPRTGTRVFNVTAQGQAWLSNYNVSATVGNYVATQVQKTVTVTGGVLNLGFTTVSNEAKIAGIEIFSGSATPTPTVSITPTPTPGVKSADLTGDGHVNIFDLSYLISKWETNDTKADLNSSGTVDIFDLSNLLSQWTG
jgi:hypothetical protein